MTKDCILKFAHDEDKDGWCSLCQGRSVRGVRIRPAEVTGGVPQAIPSFDRDTDAKNLEGRNFFYRIGTCCVGKMVGALEKRGA